MIGEAEWRSFNSNHNQFLREHRFHPEVLTRLTVSPCKIIQINEHTNKPEEMQLWPTASTSEENNEVRNNEFDITTSSSSNSGVAAEVGYKRQYRFTLPTISTSKKRNPKRVNKSKLFR